MATDQPAELRVRIDPAIRARLDHFSARTRRSLTQATNVLLDAALSVAESQEHVDNVLTPLPKESQ